MANLINQSFNYVILSSLLLFFSSISVDALNIGVQATDAAVTLSKECSRKCESEFCSVPPFLRYGKYCGLLYSGCPGEKPCDGLDACCMNHDACVQAKNNDYLSQECSQNFINCMANFKKTGGHTFKGNKCDVNEVIDVISLVMDAALLAGSTSLITETLKKVVLLPSNLLKMQFLLGIICRQLRNCIIAPPKK